MKYLRSQNGDTLIEVVIALGLLASVLLSSYAVATRSFRLGQIAKERQQLTAAMQKQAEYLRFARDKSDWPTFQSVYGNGGTPFYISDPDPATGVFPALNGVPAPAADSRYLRVSVTPVCDRDVLPAVPDGVFDRCIFTIHGEWDTVQGVDTSDFPYTLVNDSYLKVQSN